MASSSPSLPSSQEKESEILSTKEPQLRNKRKIGDGDEPEYEYDSESESVPLLGNKEKSGEPESKSKSKSESPLLPNNNKNIGSSSSSVGTDLFALLENVVELIKLESIESNLQLEMLKTQKQADDIMNGLVNHMGFLLLYTMGGLTLQVSDHVGCLSAWFIMLIVTLTFGVGLTMGYKMAKLKLERMHFTVKELNQKKKNLTLQANQVRDSESRRIGTAGGDVNSRAPEQGCTDADGNANVNPQAPGQGSTDGDVAQQPGQGSTDGDVAQQLSSIVRSASVVSGTTVLINDDAKQLSNMVRAASVISRADVLINSSDMTAFDDINRKMFRYIFACGIVYLFVVGIFFIFNNCGDFKYMYTCGIVYASVVGIFFFFDHFGCRIRTYLCPED